MAATSSSSSSSLVSTTIAESPDGRDWHLGRPMVLLAEVSGSRPDAAVKVPADFQTYLEAKGVLVQMLKDCPAGCAPAALVVQAKLGKKELPIKQLRQRFPQAFLVVLSNECQSSATYRQHLLNDCGVNMVDRDWTSGQLRVAIDRALQPYLNETKGAYKCQYCQLGPMTEDDLWQHTPLFHINCPNFSARSYQCPIGPPTTKPPGRYMVHVYNEHGPPGRGEMHSEARGKQPKIYSFALVVCRRPSDGKYLLVQEFAQEGFWLPGGGVDAQEILIDAAKRETLEEAGIHVRIMGILRFEHQPCPDYVRLRIIFYAEPEPGQEFAEKTIPDYESCGAVWVSADEVGRGSKLSLRGHEPALWINYLENNGPIYPLSLLSTEHSRPVISPLVQPTATPSRDE